MTLRPSKDGIRQRIIEGVEDIPCPFCDGHFDVGKVITGQGLIQHTKPQCDIFEKMNPLDFLIAARKAHGIPDDEESCGNQ